MTVCNFGKTAPSKSFCRRSVLKARLSPRSSLVRLLKINAPQSSAKFHSITFNIARLQRWRRFSNCTSWSLRVNDTRLYHSRITYYSMRNSLILSQVPLCLSLSLSLLLPNLFKVLQIRRHNVAFCTSWRIGSP